MKLNRNSSRIIIGVSVCVLAALLSTSCGKVGKKGQNEYEQGQAALVAQDYKTAVTQFALAANKGHAGAQYQVGLCYEEGKGVDESRSEALKWFKQAAENGNADAMYKVGESYRFGEDGEVFAVELHVEELEERQIADGAAAAVGSYYEVEDLNIDMIEAVKWYRKAAKGGNQNAKAFIDSMKDVSDTLKAAEKGDVEAMCELGECFEDGKGVKENKAEAFRWYLMAANKDYADAQYRIGFCYGQGNGVRKNAYEEAKWYKKAAEKGHAGAMDQLALCYSFGTGVRRDKAEAEKWSKLAEETRNKRWLDIDIQAAEKGNTDAMYRLGEKYQNGNGVKEDKAEAFKWFKKAAENGKENAFLPVGWKYANGDGVEENKAEAVKWYKKSAENGNTTAMNNLAWMYHDGDGVKTDKAEAFKWFKKAAENGNKDAMKWLGDCYEKGVGVEQDEAEAEKWHKRAEAARE